MMMGLMLFILNTIGSCIRLLYLSVSPKQIAKQDLNCCCKQCKVVAQYRKKFAIWELGKNKFS
jgi:hypothetical protein